MISAHTRPVDMKTLDWDGWQSISVIHPTWAVYKIKVLNNKNKS